MPIASGTYTHYEGGQPNGISETWQFQTLSQLELTFTTPAYQLRASIGFDDQQRSQCFDYRVDDDFNGIYQVKGAQLLAERTLPNNTQLDDVLVWSETAILDLPFLSCKGRTILYMDQYGTVPTFAPHLRSGDRAGDLAKKSVETLGDETISLADNHYHATKFRYGHLYWIDEDGVVLKVEADNYEMVLTEYTRLD